MARVSVIGAGAFGTALALYCERLGHEVRVWAFDEGLPENVARDGENAAYLPGFPVPTGVSFSRGFEAVLSGADLVLLAVPSAHMRGVTLLAGRYLPASALVVSTAKGIESESLALMNEVLAETLPDHRMHTSYLSGPSFAKDVAAGLPADLALAAEDIEVAHRVQAILHSPRLRVYTTRDVIGVEIGGALKNVIAVACGAAHGFGLGASAVASLMTRGLAELTRLGAALGADPLTFLGLAGVGDLTLTCTGALSRNRTLGERLASGERAEEIVSSQKAVAEGFVTAASAHALAVREGVDMPITGAVYRVCHEGADVRVEALRLLSREMKDER